MTLLSIESLKPVRIAPTKAAFTVVKTVLRRVSNLGRAWNHRRQMAELAQFDDRMLADLGLVRGDVAAAVSEPLWRDATTRLSVLAIERRAAERDYARWRKRKAADLRAARKGRSFEICAE